MNCTRAREAMSHARDRRLDAAGQRELGEHLLRCAACKHEHDRFESAMHRARTAPRARVAADFKGTLMTRIAAGEGTPETIARRIEPGRVISLRDKLQFVLMGAAAAALLLLSAGYFLPGGPIWSRSESPSRDDLRVGSGAVREVQSSPGNAAGSLRAIAPNAPWGGSMGGGSMGAGGRIGRLQVVDDNKRPVTTAELARSVRANVNRAYGDLYRIVAAPDLEAGATQGNPLPRVADLAAEVDAGFEIMDRLSKDCLRVTDDRAYLRLLQARPILAQLRALPASTPLPEVARLLGKLREITPPELEGSVRVSDGCQGPDPEDLVNGIMSQSPPNLHMLRIIGGQPHVRGIFVDGPGQQLEVRIEFRR